MPRRDQVSIKDVAERAGVALGTVSNVLNRPDKVAEGTRQRVQAVIDELGFVRNDAARQLKTGTSRSLGLIILDAGNPFFTDLARGAEREAQKLGLAVLLASSYDDPTREATYLDLFEQQRVQGVLVTPVGEDIAHLERLSRRGLATVLVDRAGEPRRSLSSVSVDDVAGGRLAVDHLIEQGCRRIAFVGGPLTIRQVTDRLRGAHEAAAAHPDVQIEVVLQDGLTVPAGRAAGDTIVQRSAASRPDGIFCANDLLAVGVLQSVAMLARLSVPGDLALVGYDDIAFAAATVVPLTSVRQPAELLGATAVRLLAEAVGADGLGAAPQHVVFQPELVVRASSLRSGS